MGARLVVSVGKKYIKTYIKTHIQSKNSGVSTKRHYEYPDDLKQLTLKLAEEVGVYQAAKTLNLKIQGVRKWKSGITEYQGAVQSDEEKLRCKICLQECRYMIVISNCPPFLFFLDILDLDLGLDVVALDGLEHDLDVDGEGDGVSHLPGILVIILLLPSRLLPQLDPRELEQLGGDVGHEPVDVGHGEDEMFHPENLTLVVGIVRDVDKLLHVGRLDLLVLFPRPRAAVDVGLHAHVGRIGQRLLLGLKQDWVVVFQRKDSPLLRPDADVKNHRSVRLHGVAGVGESVHLLDNILHRLVIFVSLGSLSQFLDDAVVRVGLEVLLGGHVAHGGGVT